MAASDLARPPRPVVDEQNPYAGLQTFTEQDAAFFFGRGREADALFRLVRRGTLTILFGASGLGKSSLLGAGLFPQLREERFLPVLIRLNFAEESPDLVGQIRERLKAEAEAHDAAPPEAKQTLWEYFHREAFWDEQNHPLTPVLVFDQFEEIFTLGRRPDAQAGVRALVTELADLVENQVPTSVRDRLAATEGELPFTFNEARVKVILALREDYLPALEDLRSRMPSLVRNRFRLTPMDGLQAKQAVLGPAPELIDDGVALDVVRFAAGSKGNYGEDDIAAELGGLEVEPALLSLVCQQLNARRRARDMRVIEKSLLTGAREEIYRDFYEDSVADLPEAVRSFIEDDLITESGFRTAKAEEEATRRPGVTKEVIGTLVDRRILRLGDRLGIPHVELIHDVLTPVVQQSRDTRRLQAEEKRRRRRSIMVLAVLGLIVAGVIALLMYQDRSRAAELQLQQEELKQREADVQRFRDQFEELTEKSGGMALTDQLLVFEGFRDAVGSEVPRAVTERIGTLEELIRIAKIEELSEMSAALEEFRKTKPDRDLPPYSDQVQALAAIKATVESENLPQYEKLERLTELREAAGVRVASLEPEIERLQEFQRKSPTVASENDFVTCSYSGPRDIRQIDAACRSNPKEEFRPGEEVFVFFEVARGPVRLSLEWNGEAGPSITTDRRGFDFKTARGPALQDVRLYGPGRTLLGRRQFKLK
ncbi:MAG: nSTAND1 domain-containing NTPase [Planctomycetota bacterium]|jgi:hypothetical protein